MLFMAFLAGSLSSGAIGWTLFWCVLGLIASDRSWPTFIVPLSVLLLAGPNVAAWSILLIWALELFDVVLFSSKDNATRGRINELLHKHLGLITDKPSRYGIASKTVTVDDDVVDIAAEEPKEDYVNPKKKVKSSRLLRETED